MVTPEKSSAAQYPTPYLVAVPPSPAQHREHDQHAQGAGGGSGAIGCVGDVEQAEVGRVYRHDQNDVCEHERCGEQPGKAVHAKHPVDAEGAGQRNWWTSR